MTLESVESPETPIIAEASETFLEPAPPTAEEIAAEAYMLYCARGHEDGHDVEDWLAAEALLLARRRGGDA
ncbi:MAG TPA: DUF2934 domain-containing protein [Vicinamibacterales bacterium]|jgi:hypothetical protein|nr:DUF2934 domain-containing protein [Vicinamibacterales bacterium]